MTIHHACVQKYAEAYALDNVYEPAFQRCTGFTKKTSAGDIVHAVTALLEERHPLPVQHDPHEGDASSAAETGDWKKAFWHAYEALPGKDSRSGILPV